MIRTYPFAFLAAFGAILAISFPQFADPLIRYDDYPGFFGEPEIYYQKTLTEGRWLNYWWMLLETVWPSSVTFAFYQLGWVVFAAAAAVNALGPGARRLDLALLTVLIAFSPQAFLISGWFNTLLAGIWLVAGFAVASLFLSVKGARWLFLIAAPVSMMSYSTYPLLLFGILMTRHDIRRSLFDLVLLVAILAAAVILGMVLMYAINWYAHGVFGIPLADWREPNPASDMTGLSENFRNIPAFFIRLFFSMGFVHAPLSIVNLTMLAGALAILATRRPMEATYLLAAIGASIGLMIVHSLKSGAEIPVRSLIVLWIYLSVAVIRAVQVYAPPEKARSLLAILVVMAALYGGELLKNVHFSNAWQVETRELAARIPPDAERVRFYGHILSLDSAVRAAIIHHYALALRMRQLTGLDVVNCGDPAVTCDEEPPFDIDAPLDGEVKIEQVGGTVYVLLPSLPEGRGFRFD